jgi:peroxiredoxin
MPAAAMDSPHAELAPWQGGAKPRLELDSLDHGRISLDDHRGRAVVVHFFATWCEPCVEELGSLERLAARRHGKDLTILAVDVGEVDARVRSFFRKHPVSFPVLLDRDRRAIKAWEVMALPTSFVLDPDLSPVLLVEGDIDWDQRTVDIALDEAIKCPAGGGPAIYGEEGVRRE